MAEVLGRTARLALIERLRGSGDLDARNAGDTIAWLEHLLDGRDAFIADQGLWNEFKAQLPKLNT